jgi:Uri superfamily endonuclease
VSPDRILDLPPPIRDGAPGSYVLVLRLEAGREIEIGQLGSWDCPAGHYMYVGSAFGPGGLLARLHHHLHPAPKPHWHIDHLLQTVPLEEIWCAAQPRKRECDWARLLSWMHGVQPAIPGFGSSDCRCPEHLFFSESAPDAKSFRWLVRERFPEDGALRMIR